MTNFSPHGSGGAPPAFPSNPGAAAGSTMSGRRSSYASVLSGAPIGSPSFPQQTSRSGPFSYSPTAQNTTAGGLPHSYPPPHPYHRSHHSVPSNAYRGPLSGEGFGKETLFSSSAGLMGDGSWTGSMAPGFFIPSYLRDTRHIERLEERHKQRVTAAKESRSNRSSTGGSLSTSASNINLHKMAPSHRGMTFDIQENIHAKSDDQIAPLPTRWSATDKFQGLEEYSDGLEVKFTGPSKQHEEMVATVRADHPMPRECGIYYFEITVLGKGKEGLIGVGFCSQKAALHRIPGWEDESWAYHGDDGKSFCQSAQGKTYGPKFGHLDVIGCGVNFRTQTAFFTKNGVNLGTAFREIRSVDLYPCVGMKKPGEYIRVNFGQSPFIFDINGMVAREKELLYEEVIAEDTGPLISKPGQSETAFIQELVAQYLAHDGYIETAKAFAEELRQQSTLLYGERGVSRTPAYKEDEDAIRRQRIRAAILDGDIDQALKLTHAYYPTVLQDNENVYFKLRCRKFIEMIRRANDLQLQAYTPPVKPTKRNSSNSTLSNVQSKLDGTFGLHSNGHNQRQSSGDDYADVFDGRMELDDGDEQFSDANETPQTVPTPPSTTNGRGASPTFNSHAAGSAHDLMAQTLEYGRELQSEFRDDPRREVKRTLEDTFALIAYADARESSLAALLEPEGRVPVAEELNTAILVSLGRTAQSGMERCVAQTDALIDTLVRGPPPAPPADAAASFPAASSTDWSGVATGAALVNVRKDFLR